jgi:hypothetical protein
MEGALWMGDTTTRGRDGIGGNLSTRALVGGRFTGYQELLWRVQRRQDPSMQRKGESFVDARCKLETTRRRRL